MNAPVGIERSSIATKRNSKQRAPKHIAKHAPDGGVHMQVSTFSWRNIAIATRRERY